MVETKDLQGKKYFFLKNYFSKGINDKMVTSLKLWLMGYNIFRLFWKSEGCSFVKLTVLCGFIMILLRRHFNGTA